MRYAFAVFLLLVIVLFVVAINLRAKAEDRRRAQLPPEEQSRLKAQHESDLQNYSF